MATVIFTGGNSNYQALADGGEALRPSMVTLYALFKDLNGVNNWPTSPKVTFLTNDGDIQAVEVLAGTQNGDGSYTPNQVAGQPGQMSLSFLTTGLAFGTYLVNWTGVFLDSLTVPHTISIEGNIELGAISRTQDFIYRITQNLRDDFPEEYEISEPVPQWRPQQLFTYLREAASRFNSIGPRVTLVQIESFPPQIDDLLVSGAVCFALWARARLEKANEMDYSDGHTLRIARADFYKTLADDLYKNWVDAVQSWKRMTPPTPIGLKSQQLPFRVYRTLSLLPNSQSFFSS